MATVEDMTKTLPQQDGSFMTRTVVGPYSQSAMTNLPHANAFVVQFRTEPNPESGKLGGRVEHVASGKTATFESVQDLPELFEQMLKDAQPADASPCSRPGAGDEY